MIKIQKMVITHVDKIRRLCQHKYVITQHPHSLAAWHMVCRPKSKGGLGVISLEVQNEALLLKHLLKLFDRVDITWVDMTWKAYYTID